MSYQVKSSTFSRIYAGNHLSAMELGGGDARSDWSLPQILALLVFAHNISLQIIF